MPTTLLKEVLPQLLPFIIQIVNGSLPSGICSLELRTALLNIFIKAASLDPNIYNNDCPVSNIP